MEFSMIDCWDCGIDGNDYVYTAIFSLVCAIVIAIAKLLARNEPKEGELLLGLDSNRVRKN
jgi:hypothetical protein